MKQKPKIYNALNRQGKLLFDAAENLWKNRKELLSISNIGEIDTALDNFFKGKFGKLDTDHSDAISEAVDSLILGGIRYKNEFFQACFKYYNLFS